MNPWLRAAPALFVLAWGGNHFTPLVHLYQVAGGYPPWAANLLLGLYVAGLIPGLLIASAVSDRLGRRAVLIAGTVIGILGSVGLAIGLEHFWLLGTGRVLAGIGVGVAMSVGTSTIKELSQPPFDARADVVARAKRPALTLTLGFGAGAAVTGALAQWAPNPTTLPYEVHIGLSLLALAALLSAPESLPRESRVGRPLHHALRVPGALRPEFTRIVIPAAPWIFGASGIAYAVMPAVTAEQTGEWTTLYATALTVVTLGVAAAIQPLVPAIDRRTGGRALLAGIGMMVVGLVLSAIAAAFGSPVLAAIVAVFLGCTYGICLVAGLLHVQAVAAPEELAGMTGWFSAIAYTGFLLPSILAALLPVAGYTVTLPALAVVCTGCLALVILLGRRRT